CCSYHVAYWVMGIVVALDDVPSLRVLMILTPALSTLFPYTTLFRSEVEASRKRAFFSRASSRSFIVPSEFTRIISSGISAKSIRSEEHTSELQSRENLLCRLLLENKNLHAPAAAARPTPLQPAIQSE